MPPRTIVPTRPCLVCQLQPGHNPTCALSNPIATRYLTELLPGQTSRGWTVSGIKYTGTNQRRRQVRQAISTMQWARADRSPRLPMSTGLLFQELLRQHTFGRTVARLGHHSPQYLRVVDCSCPPCRCHCLPDEVGVPDLIVNLPVIALELRWPDRWQTYWFADLGTAAVALAIDERLDTAPAGTTVACARRWCDRCPGARKPSPGTRTMPCPCPCHIGRSAR